MLLTSTTDTHIKNTTAYLSMVQNSIIFVAAAPPPHNFTGSFPLHVTSSSTRADISVSPPVMSTRFLHTDPLLTIILLPCTDTKEVPSPSPSIPPPPDLIHASKTWFPLIKPLLSWCDMDFIKEQVVSEGGETRPSTPPLSQAKVTPHQSYKLYLRHILGD